MPLITRTLGGAGQAPILENISRGLLVVIGLWLLVRALRGRVLPHTERAGIMVGVIAGLIPCPLLFTMFLATSRGVPEAGLTFALSMMIGVGLTLAGVAAAVVVARERFVAVLVKHGTSVERLSRVLEGITGALLVLTGMLELLS